MGTHVNTSLVAADLRLRQWASEVQACQNRPAGMLIKDWCIQNNISKDAYYYHLKRVREAYLDLANTDSIPNFVEVPVEAFSSEQESTLQPASDTAAATIKTQSGIQIEIFEDTSTDFLKRLIGVLHHAE